METLYIGPINTSDGMRRVEAELQMGAVKHKVYYQTDDTNLTPSLEAFIATALIPCMKKKVSITAEGEVSPLFLSNINKAQDVFRSWKPGYGQVQIVGVQPVELDLVSNRGTGLFFSGGMDSSYTLIKNQEEIAALVFIHGFDIPLEDASLRRRMSQTVRRVGEYFNKQVIEVETNVREFLDAYVTFGFTHGAALGAIGNLLALSFRRFYIAAADTHDTLEPYGTHLDLDPCWGSERVEFIHEGLETWRWQKAARVSEYDIALDSLRVCLFSPETKLNCGKCEKCLTSMVFLQTVGGLERCTTFEAPLNLQLLSRLKIADDPEKTNLDKCLKILEQEGKDPELAAVLRRILYRPQWQKQVIKKGRKLRVQLDRRLRR
jgi:hypothetical protein